jgi:hypothetical protein
MKRPMSTAVASHPRYVFTAHFLGTSNLIVGTLEDVDETP